MTAVLSSMILAAGMFGGHLEARAEEDTIKLDFILNIIGYEGEGTPDFGEVYLRLYDNHDDRGSFTDIRSDELNMSGEGTQLTYHYECESGKYYGIAWRLDFGDDFEPSSLSSMSVSNGYITEDIFAVPATISRFTFMDGEKVYYERYARIHSRYDLRKPADPVKQDHVFLGWSEDKGSTKVVDYEKKFSNSNKNDPVTLYAVWEHPSEDRWVWNRDDDSHWRECSCGELRTAEEIHAWDDGEITREPTETDVGERTYTCTTCGGVRTEDIPTKERPTVSGNDIVNNNGNAVDNNENAVGNDTVLPEPAEESGAGNSDNLDSNSVISIDNTDNNREAEKSREPKTGVVTYIPVYATVAMITGGAYLLLYFIDDTRGMTEEEKQERISRMILWAKRGGGFRKVIVIMAVFCILFYYHSIGKRLSVSHCQLP